MNTESRRARWLGPGVIFFTVLLVQLAFVALAGTDAPFQDQWDVEGRQLYPALQDGTLGAATFFAPHNEHRIVWTKLLDVGLFRLNGQWDPLLELVVNAGLHAAAAALLAAVLAGSAGSGWVLGVTLVLAGLPLAGWHNALWGFQSQVYFVLLFAIGALALLAAPAASPRKIAAGGLLALAAMLAMGPGLLLPGALVALLVLRIREGRALWRDGWPLAALLVLALLLYQRAPEHAALQAASAGQFFLALARLLAWPHAGQPWAALILNLPLVLLGAGRLARRRSAVVGEDFVLALAGWALLVAVGAAWSRGGGTEFVAGVPSRYADLLVLLPLANVWCAVVLARAASAKIRALASAWGAFLLLGWIGLSAEVVQGVARPRAHDREAPVRLLREFQRTGDAAVFAGQPRLLVPHPEPALVLAVLRDPHLQGALPPSLQPEARPGPVSQAARAVLGR